jgi:hypothetical protein
LAKSEAHCPYKIVLIKQKECIADDHPGCELSLVQELVYNISTLPLFALMILCSFPSLCLYSSLVNQTHPAHLVVLLYLILHVIVNSFFLVLPRGAKKHFGLSPAFIRFFTFLLQLVFFVICNLLITRWFISVVPLLPSSHQNSTSIPGIPSFIWPEPLPLLNTWIYPFPNSTDENVTLPEQLSNNSSVKLITLETVQTLESVWLQRGNPPNQASV